MESVVMLAACEVKRVRWLAARRHDGASTLSLRSGGGAGKDAASLKAARAENDENRAQLLVQAQDFTR
ncbi:hypothetical protein [Caballeronia calidae]|uniref:hypothetical protein n=1 Tax=Caballeronia calidae TaxID=1777139 RepID=UPI0012FD6E66|nr:hypothetical protein [Caballeronia calidae]